MSLDVNTLKEKFINGRTYDLDTVISAAYKDLQLRTIKGHNSAIQKACTAYLKEQFTDLITKQTSIKDFDEKHKELCDGFLTKINASETIDEQKYGKAQKVINIIFKYLVAYGKWTNESQCHMPIDGFVLKWLYGTERYEDTAWSNLSYDQYIKIQNDIIEKIKSPISVGNKKDFEVKNRAEADYYVWYITKVENNYKGVKNAIRKLSRGINDDDKECIDAALANNIIKEIEELTDKIQVLWPKET